MVLVKMFPPTIPAAFPRAPVNIFHLNNKHLFLLSNYFDDICIYTGKSIDFRQLC